MMRSIPVGLTYDDVLVVPAYSEILPPDAILDTQVAKGLSLRIPFVSAAMDTVTETAMASTMAELGGLGIIHKNMTAPQQAQMIHDCKKTRSDACVGAAIGVGSFDDGRVDLLIQAGVGVLVLDSAHGHSAGIINALRRIKERYPFSIIIAGNIATAQAAIALADAGADAVKVGIGPGSICTTRIVAGIGYPQLTAVMNVAEVMRPRNIPVIADGGIKQTGDVIKALVAGASAVMLGSALAGTDQAPGERFEENGSRYKTYRGMGSIQAMQAGSADRYAQSGASSKLVPEGVVGRTPYKGDVQDVIYQYIGGLRSGMGYTGCRTIPELINAEFVQITTSGMRESHPHSIQITTASPNYRA